MSSAILELYRLQVTRETGWRVEEYRGNLSSAISYKTGQNVYVTYDYADAAYNAEDTRPQKPAIGAFIKTQTGYSLVSKKEYSVFHLRAS